jgi:hypothetical protein
MTGHERGSGGNRQFVLLAVSCAASVLLLSGCADFRRVIGMERTGPDEFAVETRAPLTIPPDFDLRPPQPGAPRPQEVPAVEKARSAIENAGPGEPGKQANPALRPPQASGPGQPSEPSTADQSLSSKLLDYQDNGAGAAVEKRETTTLKGVY